jgi:peptide/nickel transport system substrate-binding protein
MRIRLRRRFRKSQRQVEDLGSQAEQGLEQHLFGRFSRLLAVKRFVIGWITLFVLLLGAVIGQTVALSGYFQILKPVPGGIYNEGVVGSFSNANPLYATSDVDTTISRLVFAGLFTYNDQNQLVGQLASNYSVDARGTTYTVHLKPHLTWQDGTPLTSKDVAFTYHLIQDPDAQSPLLSSWQGVSVTTPDAQTIVFKLADPLASFPYTLTNGIVPQHILASIPADSLRSADFNTLHPVGSGPFSWQGIAAEDADANNAQQQIELLPFTKYVAGKPKLQTFVVHAYANQSDMVNDFKHGNLNGAEGLSSLPAQLLTDSSALQHSLLLTAENMVFFKTSTGVLADQSVRTALVEGANTSAIIKNLGYDTRAVREPLLPGQLGYDASKQQVGYNPKAAAALLDSDGWLMTSSGIRAKAGQPLTFGLTASDNPEYQQVTTELSKQWQALGVDVRVELQTPADFQNALAYHQYDAILYGISIGVDPDVFVYWDSSQADPRSTDRLNLSEFKNTDADLSLEAGRTRLNPALRAIKYQPFLSAWQQANPALGLYQPRILYVTNGPVFGLNDHIINIPTDRFSNVQNWEIHEARVTN